MTPLSDDEKADRERRRGGAPSDIAVLASAVGASEADVHAAVAALVEHFGVSREAALDAIASMDLQPKWPEFAHRHGAKA